MSRLRLILIAASVSFFAVACAQKKKVEEPQAAKVEKSQEKKAESGNLAYACLVGEDLRLVEVDKSKKRCEVHYTKYGEKEQVAWAEATPSLCTEVKNKIRTNIESAGFKCDSNVANLKAERSSAAVQ